MSIYNKEKGKKIDKEFIRCGMILRKAVELISQNVVIETRKVRVLILIDILPQNFRHHNVLPILNFCTVFKP